MGPSASRRRSGRAIDKTRESIVVQSEIYMQTVLIVDDDAETRTVLQAVLLKAGLSVFVVATGEEAVRLCRSQRIDVVLLDIWMPEKDGLETLMDIRRGAPDAKIIAMSGGGKLGSMHPLAFASRLGAKRTLTKPFTQQELLSAVSDTFGPEP